MLCALRRCEEGFCFTPQNRFNCCVWRWLSFSKQHTSQSFYLTLPIDTAVWSIWGKLLTVHFFFFPLFFFYFLLSAITQDLKTAEADRREQGATSIQAAYRGWEGRQIAGDRYVQHAITMFTSCPFTRNCMTTVKTKWKKSTPLPTGAGKDRSVKTGIHGTPLTCYCLVLLRGTV